MAQNLDRAFILFRQRRYDLAEQEFRAALAEQPQDATAHAFLGLCLCEREQYKEATEEAQLAVGTAPDYSFAHYALAQVLYKRNRYREARAAVEEALALSPENPEYCGLLAAIHLEERRWTDALAAAERGLAGDPEDTRCNNIRAIALVKLGRRAEAGATIAATLAREPESAITHANRGWALLHEGKHVQAMEHFREALRLDPQLEWARHGIVEALKSRHLIYRLMLMYFLWMSRLSRRTQWMLVIGGWMAMNYLSSIKRESPELAPIIWPVLIAYMAFVFLCWTSRSLFNLLLRLNKFGRLVLSRDEISASNWIGGIVLLTVASLGVWLFTDNDVAMFTGLHAGVMIIPLAGIFHCPKGWPRLAMTLYTAALAIVGIVSLALMALIMEYLRVELIPISRLVVRAFIVALIGASFLGNILATRTVRK